MKISKVEFWNSPMLWTILKTVLKTMSKISKHVENQVKISKHAKNHHDVTVTWPFSSILKHNNSIKSDIINEDYRSLWCYMSSLIEILCVLAGKIGFFCWQLLHDLHAMENLFFNLDVNFLYFLSNWVNLLSIFSGIRKLRSFERNPCFWNRYLIPWRWII